VPGARLRRTWREHGGDHDGRPLLRRRGPDPETPRIGALPLFARSPVAVAIDVSLRRAAGQEGREQEQGTDRAHRGEYRMTACSTSEGREGEARSHRVVG
jgi:hypothetical protein